VITYKDIAGYEGVYKVSTDGKVISSWTQCEKKQEVARNGYARTALFKNGKGKHVLIHRLVAEAFLPNPQSLAYVNHKDGDKLNNDVSNLEWCDASQNMKHAYSNGLVKPKTTEVIQYTKNNEVVKVWESVKAAAESLKLNHANIVTVCKQNTNRRYAGGFIWRYANGNMGRD